MSPGCVPYSYHVLIHVDERRTSQTEPGDPRMATAQAGGLERTEVVPGLLCVLMIRTGNSRQACASLSSFLTLTKR